MRFNLIYLATEDWYFHMHRLPQARAALAAGFAVAVACRVQNHRAAIEVEGIRVIPLGWRRGSLNPFEALAAIWEIRGVYRREKPAIVHHVALKAILLGTIAARLAKVPVIIDAFTGLGLLFLGQGMKIRLLRLGLFPVLRLALDSPKVTAIVENADHLAILERLSMLEPGQGRVIRGSGVDTARFKPAPEPDGPIIAACAARLLKSKGILVLAEAMRLLAEQGIDLTLKLAGSPDPETPDTLTESDIAAIAAQPNIDYLGLIVDMPGFWQAAHIGVLASITGEGLPVSLLEAAACGRALVATDVAGCREIVQPGINGLLVPPGNAQAVAESLARLAQDAELRKKYGAASRILVETELSADIVGRQTVQLYREKLHNVP
jgi:glycosyltransferase involved in cell wall biosynthesis